MRKEERFLLLRLTSHVLRVQMHSTAVVILNHIDGYMPGNRERVQSASGWTEHESVRDSFGASVRSYDMGGLWGWWTIEGTNMRDRYANVIAAIRVY